MARRVVFTVRSPLGYRVTLTRDRWREILRYKHPALAGKEQAVRRCVERPTMIKEHQERHRAMDKLRVSYDKTGNTLSVWFDDPQKEFVCEESDDDVVLVKDRRGRVIGFERLNYLSAKQRQRGTGIPVEVQMV